MRPAITMVMASSISSWSYWRYLPRFFLGCLSLSRQPAPSSDSSSEDPRGPRRWGDWLALPGHPCAKSGGLSLKRDEGLAAAVDELAVPSLDEVRWCRFSAMLQFSADTDLLWSDAQRTWGIRRGVGGSRLGVGLGGGWRASLSWGKQWGRVFCKLPGW